MNMLYSGVVIRREVTCTTEREATKPSMLVSVSAAYLLRSVYAHPGNAFHAFSVFLYMSTDD